MVDRMFLSEMSAEGFLPRRLASLKSSTIQNMVAVRLQMTDDSLSGRVCFDLLLMIDGTCELAPPCTHLSGCIAREIPEM